MTILDNQEVNADILNGIAKDLGCPEFSAFSDGVPFGADKLNEITAALVTPGVLGTDGDSCKVSIADGKISVGTGTIVFASGAKMKITENQVLEMVPDTKTYVVAVNDITNNRMLLYNSDVHPDEDDYVLLAEVTESGAIQRNSNCWARNKALSPQNTKKTIQFDSFTIPLNTAAETVVHSIYVNDLYKYTTICFKRRGQTSSYPGAVFYYDIRSGLCIGVDYDYNVAYNSMKALYLSENSKNGIPVKYTKYHSSKDISNITMYMRVSSDELQFWVTDASTAEIKIDSLFYTIELL